MTSTINRKLGFLIASILFMTISYLVYRQFAATPLQESNPSLQSPNMKTHTTQPIDVAGVDPSIAVLPFSNASPDPDQQYLPDELSREILELLSEIPELKVASRSSVRPFRGTEADIVDAAATLGVANVLTGSVDRAGNDLRITTRLIRADDGYVLWSETFDRSVQEVFEIQNDIAAAVVSGLQIDTAGELPTAQVFNAEAYLLSLKGRYFYGLWGEENFERSVDANQAALKIDPNYVEAWSGLAVTYLMQTQSGYLETAYGTALARNAVDKALEIDPDRASVLARLAHIQLMMEWDFAGAEKTLEHALQVASNDTRILGAAAYLANCFGRSDDALDYLERALTIDPNNRVVVYNTAEALHWAGRLTEAKEVYRKLLQLNGQDMGSHAQLAIIELQQNDPQAAWQEIKLEPEPLQREYVTLLALPALDRHDEVDDALAKFIEKNQTWAAYLIASIYAWHGNRDSAFLWLDHAYQQRASTMPQVLLEPTMTSLHGDPRWTALLGKMGLPHSM